jgi:hypothetical protein
MLIKSSNLNKPSLSKPMDWGQGDRGIWAGGGRAGTWTNNIDYISISVPANSVQFGDSSRYGGACGASGGGRGMIMGGHETNGYLVPGPQVKKMEYITIATTSNAANFGELKRVTGMAAAVSNGTRALICGGHDGAYGLGNGLTHSDIDYITIATPGDATSFGQITSGKVDGSGSDYCIDGTGNGIYGMWKCDSGNKFDYINISTPGNSLYFANLTVGTGLSGGVSNGSRAIWDNGSQNLEYFTWSTPATAIQFGKWVVINGHDSSSMMGVDDGQYALYGAGHSYNSAVFKFSMNGTPTTALITTDVCDLFQPGSINRYGTTAFAGD